MRYLFLDKPLWWTTAAALSRAESCLGWLDLLAGKNERSAYQSPFSFFFPTNPSINHGSTPFFLTIKTPVAQFLIFIEVIDPELIELLLWF